jgi:pyrroloquinoline quinone (PQQ) biosynthesis protein C
MKSSLHTVLDGVLDGTRLLTHPFYRRWELGLLDRPELTSYAEQYRYFEEMLPVFLESLSEQLPDGVARESVLDNLSDEVATPSHLELFKGFAAFYGATNATISPAMRSLVAAYFELLSRRSASSLAGLWAYESQGAEIADSKAEGLRVHYGASSEALEFWSVHGSLEGDHAQWTLEALESLDVDESEVSDAVQFIARAWWEFLDERELAK